MSLEDRSCPICLSLLFRSSGVRLRICGHSFHTSCIMSWYEERRDVREGGLECPLCRSVFFFRSSVQLSRPITPTFVSHQCCTKCWRDDELADRVLDPCGHRLCERCLLVSLTSHIHGGSSEGVRCPICCTRVSIPLDVLIRGTHRCLYCIVELARAASCGHSACLYCLATYHPTASVRSASLQIMSCAYLFKLICPI